MQVFIYKIQGVMCIQLRSKILAKKLHINLYDSIYKIHKGIFVSFLPAPFYYSAFLAGNA